QDVLRVRAREPIQLVVLAYRTSDVVSRSARLANLLHVGVPQLYRSPLLLADAFAFLAVETSLGGVDTTLLAVQPRRVLLDQPALLIAAEPRPRGGAYARDG